MDWTIFTQVTLPVLGGFAWMVIRMDKLRTEFKSDINELRKDINELRQDMSEIHKDLRNIDSRMSRLEGGFTERGYWESRDKKIGE